MKIKMLPNWGKKLGFLVFITCSFIAGYSDFMDGLTGQSYNTGKYEDLVGKQSRHVLEILSILGLIIYMFSKEKIEDDYINKLRLESFQLTSFIGLAITIIAYAISEEIRLTLDYFIILFLWIYLGVFAIKKRTY
jgi:hypothetical protein